MLIRLLCYFCSKIISNTFSHVIITSTLCTHRKVVTVIFTDLHINLNVDIFEYLDPKLVRQATRQWEVITTIDRHYDYVH